MFAILKSEVENGMVNLQSTMNALRSEVDGRISSGSPVSSSGMFSSKLIMDFKCWESLRKLDNDRTIFRDWERVSEVV